MAILAYSAKYASGLYGPFRDAVDVTIAGGGDRKGYQQDWRNAREALREIDADIAEGADMVMVKPALAYLDVIAAARQRVDVPIAAYHVSGEYAMIQAAAANGWIDRDAVALEHLTAIKRAGADVILTYFARWFAEGPGRRRLIAGRDDPATATPARCPAAGCDPVVCHGLGRAVERRAVRPLRRRPSPAASTRRSGPSRRSAAARTSSPGPRARTSATSRAAATSTSCRATAPSSSATPIQRSPPRSRRRPRDGTSYGAPTPREMKLAEAICDARAELRAGPADELGHRGDEHRGAAGPRVHRAATASSSFHGNFHGATDALLAAGGSGVATLGLPGTAGVPAGAVAETLVVPYN